MDLEQARATSLQILNMPRIGAHGSTKRHLERGAISCPELHKFTGSE